MNELKKDDLKDLHWCAKFRVCVNNLRIIPRLLIILYGYICYDTHQWFQTLQDPTTAQQMYANIIWGAAAAWFGLYVNSGYKGE